MEQVKVEVPTTTPPPVPPANPSMPAPAMMENGGSTSSGSDTNIMGMMKELNWIEIGFGILGATALYYAIYYYRYNINQSKSFTKEVQNRLDELDIKIADINSVYQQEAEQSGTLETMF